MTINHINYKQSLHLLTSSLFYIICPLHLETQSSIHAVYVVYNVHIIIIFVCLCSM